jgi:protein-disulfide isomerase
MAPTVAELLKQDRKVRIIYRDYPILAPDSRTAAQAALAAMAQGKYREMHDALMRGRMPFDEANVLRIAGEIGLDTRRLRRDMDSPAVIQVIERNMALARSLDIGGTPTYIIGDRVIPGAMDLDTLKKLIADQRAKR